MFATTLLTIAFISSIVSAQDVPAWCQNLANPISDDNPRFQLVAINKTNSAESEGLALTRGEEGIVAQYPVAVGAEHFCLFISLTNSSFQTASSGSGNDGFGPFFTLQGGRLFAINDQSGEKASTNGPGLPTIPTLTFFTFDISTQNFCETVSTIVKNLRFLQFFKN